jgi:hypothetical protein
MYSILLGIANKVRCLHLLKALSPILVKVFGIRTEFKDVQSAKALFPMLVTLLGMVMEVRE